MFSDEEIIKSLNVNPLEVKDIKFVNISELNSLNSSELTPWLQKILSADLLSSWISTVKTIEDADIDHTNLTTGIQITKYSRDPIIKL
jgi:isopentenyldiphosphate isomerase